MRSVEVDWAVRKLKVRNLQHLITWLRPSQFIFFLISKKNTLKEPQGNKRPSKYREGHKQRESKKRQNTNGTNKN